LLTLESLLAQQRVSSVDKCYNGREALKMIQANANKNCFSHSPYKVVMLDKSMPVMNGIETALQIKNL
jgi:CheY-like chemotaxis protein